MYNIMESEASISVIFENLAQWVKVYMDLIKLFEGFYRGYNGLYIENIHT
jgi:hypothetical protein